MSEPLEPPAAAATPFWATAVVIPTLWTPEQALAVFELLDDLREKVWSLYGGQIQALLKQERRYGDAGARGDDDPSDDCSF
jgi:hypothetical protein